MITSYQRAIDDICEFTDEGSSFERAAITEVADEHGADPKHVEQDVIRMRALLNPPRERYNGGALI